MYLWIKAFHIIAMVAWFAGLFYIFRLFVYHVKFRDKADCREAYELMERKLMNMIMHPALFATAALGTWLMVINPYVLQAKWIYVKLGLVALLSGYHFYSEHVRKRFAAGDFVLSERACRVINEVPTLLLFGIIYLAILKPF